MVHFMLFYLYQGNKAYLFWGGHYVGVNVAFTVTQHPDLWFTVLGSEGGEALCNCSLAQHCSEEKENGPSSSYPPSALQLPSRSQTLFSACKTARSFYELPHIQCALNSWQHFM